MICIHLEDRDGVGLRLAAVALVDRDELLVQQRWVVPRPLSRGLRLFNLVKGGAWGEGGVVCVASGVSGEAGCMLGAATRGKAPGVDARSGGRG